MTSYAYYRERFFCDWWMEPFDERVLVELFSKRFSDVFFCNGRINIFDDNSFLSLWERGFLQWLLGKMCCISCSKISVSFSESVWIAILPLGRLYVCFILIFFEERSLIRFLFLLSCLVLFLEEYVNQSDVFFFFNSTDKIYRSLILW